MFQLTAEEFGHLKSQFVMSSGGHGGRRKRPLVFTEQGVAMLSGVLRSDRAIAVNIEIFRGAAAADLASRSTEAGGGVQDSRREELAEAARSR